VKIQKFTINGGIFEPQSFALHKITGKFKGKCSAWYSSHGELTDCEWIRPDGQTRVIPPHKPMWNYLKSLGPIWK
jgi:hypothetical protein